MRRQLTGAPERIATLGTSGYLTFFLYPGLNCVKVAILKSPPPEKRYKAGGKSITARQKKSRKRCETDHRTAETVGTLGIFRVLEL